MIKFYVITWGGMPCRETGHVIASWHTDNAELIIKQTAVYLHELDAWDVINNEAFKREWEQTLDNFDVMEL